MYRFGTPVPFSFACVIHLKRYPKRGKRITRNRYNRKRDPLVGRWLATENRRLRRWNKIDHWCSGGSEHDNSEAKVCIISRNYNEKVGFVW